MQNADAAWLAWQVVDSAFPSGAFAHSWGLEAAWQQGEIANRADLERFVVASIQQAGHATLPLVNSAYRTPYRLEALDELADAFLLNAVANRVSRVQGRTLIATVVRVWPSATTVALKARAGATCAHLAPVVGAALRTIGLALPTVQQIVLFSTARGVLSAAVRLGIVGSYDAQRMQFDCGPWLDRTLAECGTLDEDSLAQTAPIVDLLQAGHDRVYSRLFQS
jgi:urease accessory protein